jgi:drug/metabolite transporter (DMT)-like permease
LAVLGALALPESLDFLQAASFRDLAFVGAVTLWSGLAVNAAAPYLQVGGQQAVGPARAQVLYASQPLWAAVLSLVFLGETVGTQGLLGGSAFLAAMMLAATSEVPDPNCGKDLCET